MARTLWCTLPPACARTTHPYRCDPTKPRNRSLKQCPRGWPETFNSEGEACRCSARAATSHEATAPTLQHTSQDGSDPPRPFPAAKAPWLPPELPVQTLLLRTILSTNRVRTPDARPRVRFISYPHGNQCMEISNLPSRSRTGCVCHLKASEPHQSTVSPPFSPPFLRRVDVGPAPCRPC